MNEPWACPVYPKGEGGCQGWVSKAGVSSETVNPAAWEYLYCVRKYLVDETGQDKVRSCCCSDPTLSVAWLHNLGSAIR